jgi:glyoxylase-like metal-dependent hydrolase (beta-lactamase superfamily II)
MRYWFPIEEGLYRLAGRLGGYALLRDGKCLIVDPPRIDWSAALAELAELGVPRADWVLATHHHRDSLAGAADLVAGGAELLAPAGEVDLIAHATDFWQSARTYILYDCDSKFSALRESVPVARGLAPGESFPLGPWQVGVLALRGHTRHHTGYVVNHASRRLAFVGAAMAGSGTVHNWCDFHWDYMDFNKGHRALLADLDGLAATKPDLLCPSHAQPLSDVAGEIDLLRANLRGFSDLVEPNRIPRQREDSYQVLPHVWFIGQTCYGIVADDGAALLFDVGYPEPTRPRLTEFCRQANVKRIEAIAFSHYHDDHCWRATEVAHGFPGTQHDTPRAEIWSHRVLAEIFTDPDRFRYPCLMPDSMHIDRVFDDGPFDFHGIPMRYVFLPGQTYWHAGLIVDVDGRRIAFTGDNIWRPSTADRPMMGPIISRNRYLPDVNHCLPARTLLDLDVNMICPAHNEAFDVTRSDLERHRDWADAVAGAVRTLAGKDLAAIDCWWCRIDPFHIYVTPGRTCPLKVVIDSPFDRPVRVRASLNLPSGFAARTMQDSMHLSPGRSESVEFRTSTPADWPVGRRLPVTVDLYIDGESWPEQAEALLIPRVL